MNRKKYEAKENTERWLLTYSDLMNLLLILFIILYCSSQINASKAAQVAQSMHEGFGGYSESGGGGSGNGTGTGNGSGMSAYWNQDSLEYQEASDYQTFYDSFSKIIEENGLRDKVDVKLDDRGVVISFKDSALFESGSAALSQDATVLIDEIGTALQKLPFSFVLIEGHTDTDPIYNAQYQDNMDLSTQRAANVWRLLVKLGLPEEKMASIGYGETRPVAPNDTSANKAKNRRVVITILKSDFDAEAVIESGVVKDDNDNKS